MLIPFVAVAAYFSSQNWHHLRRQSMTTSIRNALVTGSTTGIGQAIAETLAARGFRVVVSGRDEARGSEVVRIIRAHGGDARFQAADLSTASGASDLARASEKLLGDVDILVNNAGIFSFGPTAATTAEAFDTMFASNVRGPYFLTARLAPPMAARGWGRIVNITTMAAHFGMVGGALYGSSKAALRLLTQSWAAEFGPRGVTVNAVAPGPIRTPGTANMGEALDQLAKTTPVGRPGTPAEVADAVAFLTSESAAYVNGTTIAVDGGRTAV
jgi:NAD(P)-dependent dehydrogenase (short-subunit alcohol dehydrogenase family)